MNKLTAIVPIFNEENTVKISIENLLKVHDWEVDSDTFLMAVKL